MTVAITLFPVTSITGTSFSFIASTTPNTSCKISRIRKQSPSIQRESDANAVEIIKTRAVHITSSITYIPFLKQKSRLLQG
ncbi:MAG: hypothetical protein M0P13_03335, partial [Fibrobacteraceae bacterium]|nr:hypothetical protein [Fibrobacteraceae bacterium]